MTLFSWFRKTRINTCSGITTRTGISDQLLTQIITDENLEQAFDWLCQQNPTQDHSDVWAYRRDWAQHKPALQQRINAGRFSFQAVREVDITDEQGHINRREIRPAADRLLIRAIAQVLKPLFGEALSKDCVHLAGNGGLKATVAQVEDYISQHPNHQVIKSDVKGYYANIDHTVLNEQFQHLLPNEPVLHSLLWNFMRRTVEFGGNYREVECGLPLGASLSPLLAALYLSPLDELAKNTPNTFYRRHMDDRVWVLPKKQHLRKAMKKQYGISQALRVAMHPDKTFINKVSKGFDFLRVHLTPTGVTVSDTSLSRHEQKVARLYERGASTKRIRAYRLRWLLWATVSVGTPAQADMAQNALCPVGSVDSSAPFTYLFLVGPTLLTSGISTTGSLSPSNRACPLSSAELTAFLQQPVENNSCPSTTASQPIDGDGVTYWVRYDSLTSGGTFCINKFTSAGGVWISSQSVAPPDVTPTTSIPAYGPFAYVASFMGLLWFARRRKRR